MCIGALKQNKMNNGRKYNDVYIYLNIFSYLWVDDMVVGEIFDGQRFRNELPPLFLGDYFLAFLQKLHIYVH
jgi:hypothetical protein